MNNFLETFKNLGPTRLAAMGSVIVGMLAFFIFIITRLSTPTFGLLYSDLDLADSAEIVTQLESMGIDYELKSDGQQIFVPREQVTRLRMSLATEGLPQGGLVGNEIFDDSDGLGNSNFVQNMNRLRALEGELSRTISSLESVASARVHIVLPERELFSRNRQDPSASIVLKMRGAGRLGKEQVAAVQHLVASAVPGLSPNKISIVDGRGMLLAEGSGDADSLFADNATERQRVYEQQLARQIEDLLSQTIGPGRVRARVTADMDFDRVVTNSEIFDPESAVVRSTQTIEESISSSEANDAGQVSVQGNLPEALGQPDPAAGAGGSSNEESRTEETVNFEISRVVKEEIRESGIVNRLSVAVLVDGTYNVAEDGTREYQPRSEQELQQLEAIIKSAIGFDDMRGDQVELVNMQFVDAFGSEETVEPGFMGLDKATLTNLIELIVMGVVAILALLLVVRPLMTRLFDSVPSASDMASAISGGQGAIAGGATPALTGPNTGGNPQALPAGGAGAAAGGGELAEIEASPSEIEEMINIRQIEGQIKASSIKKIGEIIEKHPEQAANVVRTWLYEDAEGE